MAWSVQGNLKGPQGAQGLKGDKGDKGDDGTGVSILGSYNTEAELVAAHPTGSPGDAYLVAGDLYVWDAVNNTWNNVGSIKGPKGDPGDEGPPGTPGSDSTVPGPKGDPGNPGTPGVDAMVSIGSTSTGAPGSNAAVTNTGTPGAAIFNFTIPRGDAGAAGTPGAPGTTWHFGTGAPGAVPGAVVGDAYLDMADGTVYRLS